jgi:hypothetical protein
MPKGIPKHTPAKPRFAKNPNKPTLTPAEVAGTMALVPVLPRHVSRNPLGPFKRKPESDPPRKRYSYDKMKVRGPESQEQREAFDYYISLGDTRSMIDVAAQFKRNIQTIRLWGAKYKWMARAKQHEATHAETLLIEPHAVQQEKRRFGLLMIDKILRSTVTLNPDGTIASCSVDAKSPSDLRTLLTLRDELLNPERGSKTTFAKGSSINAENAVFIIKK